MQAHHVAALLDVCIGADVKRSSVACDAPAADRDGNICVATHASSLVVAAVHRVLIPAISSRIVKYCEGSWQVGVWVTVVENLPAWVLTHGDWPMPPAAWLPK